MTYYYNIIIGQLIISRGQTAEEEERVFIQSSNINITILISTRTKFYSVTGRFGHAQYIDDLNINYIQRSIISSDSQTICLTSEYFFLFSFMIDNV